MNVLVPTSSVEPTAALPELPRLSLGGSAMRFTARRMIVAVISVTVALLTICGALFTVLGVAPDVVTVSGVIVPNGVVDVVAPEQGEIVSVTVSSGSRVAKGDTLLTLRSDHLDEQIQQLRMTAAEQQALLRLASADTSADRERRNTRVSTARMRLQTAAAALVERMTHFGIPNSSDSLLASHVTGRHVEIDRAVAEHRMAQIELAAAEFEAMQPPSAFGEIERTRLALQRATQGLRLLSMRADRLAVVAKADGVITTEGVERLVGTYVPPGQKMLEIADHAAWAVEADLSESDVGRVEVGSDVVLEIMALAEDDVRELRGTVRSISMGATSGAANRTTATYRARIEIAEPPPGDVNLQRIRSGYSVRARITGDQAGYARRLWQRLASGAPRVP